MAKLAEMLNVIPFDQGSMPIQSVILVQIYFHWSEAMSEGLHEIKD